MNMHCGRGILLFHVLLTGCASMPTGSVGYYLPRGDFDVVVTQTAACSKNAPIMRTDVSVVPRYERDQAALHSVDMGPFNKGKSKLAFSFYEDDRLKGINNSHAGQGGEIVSAAMKALPVVRNLTAADRAEMLLQSFPAADPNSPSSGEIARFLSAEPEPNCGALQAIGGDKPVTVIRESRGVLQNIEERPDDNEIFPFRIDQTTLPDDVFASVSSIFGYTSATFTILPVADCELISGRPGPYCVEPRFGSGPTLPLRQPARVRVEVTVLGAANGNHVFEKEVLIPQYGRPFELPMVKPRGFGESSFELALSEAGNITSLGYGKGGSAAAAIGAVGTIADGLAGETAAERAAALKAEADLIAQQQRLIRCQTEPENCT